MTLYRRGGTFNTASSVYMHRYSKALKVIFYRFNHNSWYLGDLTISTIRVYYNTGLLLKK